MTMPAAILWHPSANEAQIRRAWTLSISHEARSTARNVLSRARHRLSRLRAQPETDDSFELVQHLRRRAAVAEASLRQRERSLSDVLPPPEARSQYGEDALLWDLVGASESGFFIEAGAYDGYQLSVSYLFESVGWSGLLVEPLPERADECRRRRPRSSVVQAALRAPGGAASVALKAVDSAEMLSYTDITPTHERRLAQEPEVVAREIMVPAKTLDELLKDSDRAVDFVVLDVEGNEGSVLEGFDLARWKPRVLLIEDNSNGDDRSVELYLARQGYDYLGAFFGNDLYTRQGETKLLRERLISARWIRPTTLT